MTYLFYLENIVFYRQADLKLNIVYRHLTNVKICMLFYQCLLNIFFCWVALLVVYSFIQLDSLIIYTSVKEVWYDCFLNYFDFFLFLDVFGRYEYWVQ